MKMHEKESMPMWIKTGCMFIVALWFGLLGPFAVTWYISVLAVVFNGIILGCV